MNNIIYTSAPINKLAALVTSKGYEYKPNIKPSAFNDESATPFQTMRAPSYMTNLAGYKFGRFTVIGLMRSLGKAPKSKWVVKCSCGIYAHRSEKAIKNPSNNLDCCKECRHLIHLKRSSYKNSFDKWKEPKEFF